MQVKIMYFTTSINGKEESLKTSSLFINSISGMTGLCQVKVSEIKVSAYL